MQPERLGSAYNLERTIAAFRTGVVCSPQDEYAVCLYLHTTARRVEMGMFDPHELTGLIGLLLQEAAYIGGDYLRHVVTFLGEQESTLSQQLVKHGEGA